MRSARRLPGNRAQKLAALDAALELAARTTRDAELGQASLFGETSARAPTLTPKLPSVAGADDARDAGVGTRDARHLRLGPSAGRGRSRCSRAAGASRSKNLRDLQDDAAVTIAGMVTARAPHDDESRPANSDRADRGHDRVVRRRVFSKIYAQAAAAVRDRRDARRQRAACVCASVRGAAPGEEPRVELSVAANEVTPFVPPAAAASPAPLRGWHVDVTHREQIDRLARLIDEWPGEVPVVMHVRGRSQRVARAIAGDARVRGELERIFAPQGVREGALDADNGADPRLKLVAFDVDGTLVGRDLTISPARSRRRSSGCSERGSPDAWSPAACIARRSRSRASSASTRR